MTCIFQNVKIVEEMNKMTGNFLNLQEKVDLQF
jgi:hypothetical protein